MARGIVKLPLEKGRKELAWYVGNAGVYGTNQVNPVVPLKVERDADFVVKRLFLVQWPSVPAVSDVNLALPATANALIRDGGTKRGLQLVGSYARGLFFDANPAKMAAAYLGLSCPFLIRANNSLFVELSNPGAVGTPWAGDLYLVAEGFKIYPFQAEEFPSTITQYAVPFELNGNLQMQDPNAGSQYVAGQYVVITNNGEGKMLVKGMKVVVIDAAGIDRTAAILPCLSFNIIDSTSGTKRWVQNTNQGVNHPACPASLMTMAQTFLPWNMPRYIDPNGTVQIQVVFPQQAALLAPLTGIGTWPFNISISLFGALLPR